MISCNSSMPDFPGISISRSTRSKWLPSQRFGRIIRIRSSRTLIIEVVEGVRYRSPNTLIIVNDQDASLAFCHIGPFVPVQVRALDIPGSHSISKKG